MEVPVVKYLLLPIEQIINSILFDLCFNSLWMKNVGNGLVKQYVYCNPCGMKLNTGADLKTHCLANVKVQYILLYSCSSYWLFIIVLIANIHSNSGKIFQAT
jgi:hypothetical protein